ncbi:DUF3830 family protein [Pseudalkalibacillus berkeleyi]|uniref:DUF3830 family protein n=1 Tax=Pseudalkalibacillus berkeleyi TaxID=1069813 RepID=A0ABS9H2X2_9BACL|nr:DUF3830 family protein [Pseudalkalibacillus berkeleyi]MCF6138416.1 DUF3830 family protein [Pseudalkalibacillus berkeleyi]
MRTFIIEFPKDNVVVRANLLDEKAPQTCEAFWNIIEVPLETSGKHAMYTGKEISVQFPQERCGSTALHEVRPENQTCFPQPGELLFTYVGAYAWEGMPKPIYDVGCFYGPDARTFFPMGWLPGNKFAKVWDEDLEKFAEMGTKASNEGIQPMVFKRG